MQREVQLKRKMTRVAQGCEGEVSQYHSITAYPLETDFEFERVSSLSPLTDSQDDVSLC